jgi:hypothetical protein
MLPGSEGGAGKELGLDAEGDVQAWSGGRSGVVGILRHECGGCKNGVQEVRWSWRVMFDEVEGKRSSAAWRLLTVVGRGGLPGVGKPMP